MPQTHTGFSLEVAVTSPTRAMVRVRGELDSRTAPGLRDGVSRLVDDGISHLVLDVSGLAFIDSTGLGVLVGAHRRVRERGGQVVLLGPTRGLLKVLELTGLAGVLPVEAPLADW